LVLSALALVIWFGAGEFRSIGTLAALAAYASYRSLLGALARTIGPAEIAKVENTQDFTLYLRSFSDDDFRFDLAAAGWRRFLFLPPTGVIYENTFRSSRLEELVVRTLWRYRPVIGVTTLEASANPIGALPVSLSDASWKDAVVRKMAHCRTILSVLGGTPGVLWEIRLLLDDPDLRSRAFFLVPQEEPDEVIRRWRACFGFHMPTSDHTIERTIVAKPLADGRLVVMTATQRTVNAYRMALDLAEGLVAREVEVMGAPAAHVA
jgi:hypothetical protein